MGDFSVATRDVYLNKNVFFCWLSKRQSIWTYPCLIWVFFSLLLIRGYLSSKAKAKRLLGLQQPISVTLNALSLVSSLSLFFFINYLSFCLTIPKYFGHLLICFSISTSIPCILSMSASFGLIFLYQFLLTVLSN